MRGELELKQVPQTRQLLKVIGRIKLSDLIELSEQDFAKLIKKLESNPLFKKLFSPSNAHEKVIGYFRFPRTDLSRSFYELREDIMPGGNSPDVKSFLQSRKEIVPLIKRLGIEKFKRYFLYSNGELSYRDISSACSLTEREVRKMAAFVDDFTIQSEFSNPSLISTTGVIHYSKVAQVEKEKSGDLVISFFSPHLAKGRYLVNYERLAELKRKGVFSWAELKKVDKLLNDLRMINARKSIIYRIIDKILKIQSPYFCTGNSQNLLQLTQRQLAREMNIDPSILSRAIARRSIETPWGEECPLKYFFPSKKKIMKRIVIDIIKNGKSAYSDERIRQELIKTFNIHISRRSIASYRKELKIPGYRGRAKSYKVQ